MNPPSDLDWLFKFRQCKYYYQVQAADDEVRCRLKYCGYEPSDEAEKFHKLIQRMKMSGRTYQSLTK